MAYLKDVLNALKAAIIPILPTIAIPNSDPVANIDWTQNVFVDTAAIAKLQNTARAGGCVSIFDLGVSRNTTRYALAYQFELIVNPVGVTTTVSSPVLSAGATRTITLGIAPSNTSGNPLFGDGVSANFAQQIKGFGSCGIATAGMTLAQLATALAVAINANVDINTNVSASATGAVVTITNNSTTVNYALSSAVGNLGSVMQENARSRRPIQIMVWAQTYGNRDNMANAILDLTSWLQLYGITQADNTQTRVWQNYNHNRRDDKFSDIWGHEIVIDVEFASTPTLHLYSLLVPAYTIQAGV